MVLTRCLVKITTTLGGYFISNPENNNRKEEILAKSRESSNAYNDESMAYAVSKGKKLGNFFAVPIIIGFPLWILSVITAQTLTAHALVSVYCAFCFGGFLAKYRFTGQKRYLIAVICHVLLGIGTVASFVVTLGTLRGWWG